MKILHTEVFEYTELKICGNHACKSKVHACKSNRDIRTARVKKPLSVTHLLELMDYDIDSFNRLKGSIHILYYGTTF